ncbi:MAG: FKBP-type peptidyl-prolyl cis-trans isomerase [Bacteroidota bacterium]
MRYLHIILIALVFLIGCKQKDPQKTQQKKVFTEQEYIKANRYMVNEHKEIIQRFVERKNWDMHTTGSGLWYMIYENGTGDKVDKETMVQVDYELKLLDGTVCYSTKTTGPQWFTIGKGRAEPGLEEGVLMLREGAKARFILPPHLAHGLPGDLKKIPPYSIVLYETEILDVKKSSE